MTSPATITSKKAEHHMETVVRPALDEMKQNMARQSARLQALKAQKTEEAARAAADVAQKNQQNLSQRNKETELSLKRMSLTS